MTTPIQRLASTLLIELGNHEFRTKRVRDAKLFLELNQHDIEAPQELDAAQHAAAVALTELRRAARELALSVCHPRRWAADRRNDERRASGLAMIEGLQ